MQKAKPRHRGPIVASLALWMAAIAPALAQSGSDPVGELKRTSVFDRAQHVDVGKSAAGSPVCYFREQGSSHTLDIGIGAFGAFIRVASGDGPLETDAVPQPPLKVFAGKEVTKLVDGDVKSTGEYTAIAVYDGAIDYVPNIRTAYAGGFLVVAKGDTKPFFDMIVRARGEFVVVQSQAQPRNVDVIAIYNFNSSAASALLACAKRHVQA